MTTHTPGPWTRGGQFRDGARRINGPDGMALATALDFNRFDRDAEADANARLIAAAPGLLAALEAAEEALGSNLVWITDRVDLQVRQGDTDTLQRLAQLRDAWQTIVRALTEVHG